MKLSSIIKYKHIKKEYISKHRGEIKTQLKTIAYSICYTYIRQADIEFAIKNFTFGYIYRDTKNNDNIVGFVLWKIEKSKDNSKSKSNSKYELYVCLICGMGYGELMFDDIESYAIRHNIQTITLKPSNNITANIYIKKYGFALRGYDKIKQGDIYYKNIILNKFNLSKYTRTKNRGIKLKSLKTAKKKKIITNTENNNNLFENNELNIINKSNNINNINNIVKNSNIHNISNIHNTIE
jgi:hypothetical protein